MFDPPITDAANIFILVTVVLIAAGVAIAVIDVYKNFSPKKKTRDKK